MVAAALLKVELFDSKTNEMLVRKHYLPGYQLVLDEKGTLKNCCLALNRESTVGNRASEC
jgi:hypothetical protein